LAAPAARSPEFFIRKQYVFNKITIAKKASCVKPKSNGKRKIVPLSAGKNKKVFQIKKCPKD